MEGVTDTLAWLGHGPRWRPGGLDGLETQQNFRIVSLAEKEVAYGLPLSTAVYRGLLSTRRSTVYRGLPRSTR